MSRELTKDQLEHASILFAQFPYDRSWVTTAIARKRGRLYTESKDLWTSAILWPERGAVSFMVGDPLSAGAMRILADYISDSRENPPPIWFLSVASEVAKNAILQRYDPDFVALKRVSFAHAPANLSKISGWESELPDGCELRKIDRSLVARIPKEIDADFSLFWESADDFLDNGIGYCLMRDNRILSVANAAFPLKRQTTIGVATAPDHQGKGYSTLTCRPLIEYCMRKGVQPCFTTGADNVAARSVARKLGFAGEQTHWWLLHT